MRTGNRKGETMPIKIANDLPVRKQLEDENIFVMDEARALAQNIRPLEIVILNLMPLKEATELALLRSLSNTPLQVNVTFMRTESYESKNAAKSHLDQFYVTFAQIKDNYYDGVIITGAPVEHLEFEQVEYWPELTAIMDWTETHATSTLHICWGAQAGLYHHYGIKKYLLEKKLSGVYVHYPIHRKTPLIRGFDDHFMAPQSRYTGVRTEDIEANERLQIVAASDIAGPYLIIGDNGKHIFVTGHPEYDNMTLDAEYRRDLAKGINPDIPENYYTDNNPDLRPVKSWRCHANTLYANWLNYYVYQETPYILGK